MQKETLTIKRLGINGEGIGYIHKKICFIPKALPGEEADVEIDVNERRYMIGHITHLRKISPARVESPCRQSKNCQGCAFMHMNYPDQLLFKEIYKSFFKTDKDITGYRSKSAASLSFINSFCNQ